MNLYSRPRAARGAEAREGRGSLQAARFRDTNPCVVGAFRAVPRRTRSADSPGDAVAIEGRRAPASGRAVDHAALHDRPRPVQLSDADRARPLSPREQPAAGTDDWPSGSMPGPAKRRELAHDSRLYRAYLEAAERLVRTAVVSPACVWTTTEARLSEVPSGAQSASARRDGRARRDHEAISSWAEQHGLPIVDDSVKFPDLRIEYERPDGRSRHRRHRGHHAELSRRSVSAKRRRDSPAIDTVGRIGGARATNRSGRGAIRDWPRRCSIDVRTTRGGSRKAKATRSARHDSWSR